MNISSPFARQHAEQQQDRAGAGLDQLREVQASLRIALTRLERMEDDPRGQLSHHLYEATCRLEVVLDLLAAEARQLAELAG